MRIDYQPREWQIQATKSLRRFSVLLLHRRAGKTVFNVIQSVTAILNAKHKNPVAAYIGPTLGQTKKTAWQYYKEYLEPLTKAGLVVFNENDLSIHFVKSGGYIYLFGYEKQDNIRGMYLDHVVLDEYQAAPPSFWGLVIRPMLIDHKGSAIFSGTPNGRNQLYDICEVAKSTEGWGFYKADWNDTDVIPESEKEDIRLLSSEEEVAQEYELSFDAAVTGSYFGKNITKARMEGRICNVFHDPRYPVVGGWDVGLDGIVIWYLQKIGSETRVIDCDMFSNMDIAEVITETERRHNFKIDHFVLPHDSVKRFATDKKSTVKGQLESLGYDTKLVKRTSNKKADILATKNFIDRVVFSTKCEQKQRYADRSLAPLDCLIMYSSVAIVEEEGTTIKAKKDEHRHVGDALQTLAIGFRDKLSKDVVTKNQEEIKRRSHGQPVLKDWNPLGNMYGKKSNPLTEKIKF